jgi:hypothetical protein
MQMHHFSTNTGFVFPSEPDAKLKAMWYFNSTNVNVSIPVAIEAITTNGLQVFVARSATTNGLAHRRAADTFTLVKNLAPSGFVTEETPVTIAQRRELNVYADLFFYGRCTASTNSGPFLFSYYWSPKLSE